VLYGDPTYYGGVNYNYRIGKYEVTNAQWNAFALAAGAPTGNTVEYGYNPYDEDAIYTDVQQPTNNVSWYEAVQFCNYLTSGDKSKGVYRFSGNNTNPGDFLGINRDAAILAYGKTYVLPTEDEWYKAAYYTGSGYSLYANGTDTPPIAGVNTNYDGTIGHPWNVGTGTEEQNGTFDMMGNVWEWNETKPYDSIPDRGFRAGSYLDIDNILASSFRGYYGPFIENDGVGSVFGFRVAEIPEPATILLLTLGGLVFRKRK
jgi:formylglycine-generating enzyme required for sulfatase activity